MNDEKLVLAIKEKDETAMAEVMKKYTKLLWSVASAVLVNAASLQDVEECVADVFIQLWYFPEQFNPTKGKLSTWLSMVSRSKAIDRYRKIVRKAEVPIDEAVLCGRMGILTEVMEKEEARQVYETVRGLEEPEREIILRRYYYGQKPKEIAIVMDMPKKQVENHLYQAKKKLQKRLGKGGKTNGKV